MNEYKHNNIEKQGGKKDMEYGCWESPYDWKKKKK